MNVMSAVIGSTRLTMRAERQSPRKPMRTSSTSRPPMRRLVVTVEMAALVSSLRL